MTLVVIIIFSLMIHYGMDSNVLVWRLPAVLTPTCRGSTRHSVRPPLRALNSVVVSPSSMPSVRKDIGHRTDIYRSAKSFVFAGKNKTLKD